MDTGAVQTIGTSERERCLDVIFSHGSSERERFGAQCGDLRMHDAQLWVRGDGGIGGGEGVDEQCDG